jgi:hypothetical protein
VVRGVLDLAGLKLDELQDIDAHTEEVRAAEDRAVAEIKARREQAAVDAARTAQEREQEQLQKLRKLLPTPAAPSPDVEVRNDEQIFQVLGDLLNTNRRSNIESRVVTIMLRVNVDPDWPLWELDAHVRALEALARDGERHACEECGWTSVHLAATKRQAPGAVT